MGEINEGCAMICPWGCDIRARDLASHNRLIEVTAKRWGLLDRVSFLRCFWAFQHI